MTILVNKLNMSGFPTLGSIYADPLYGLVDEAPVGGGLSPLNNVLYSTFEGGDSWTVDLQFQAPYMVAAGGEGGTATYSNVVDVTLNNASTIAGYGITANKINAYTYRLSGTYSNVFTDGKYTFLMPDFTEKILEPTTSEKVLGLIRYQKPSVNITSIIYNFTAIASATSGGGDFVPDGNETTLANGNKSCPVAITNSVHWRFESARTNIAVAVAKGTK